MKTIVSLDKGIALVVSIVLVGTFYFSLTSHIQYVPISAPFESWIPLGFWILLISSVFIWFVAATHDLKNCTSQFVLLALIVTIFGGIEVAEVYPRFGDTYGFSYMVNYILHGFNQPNPLQPYLQNWPGWFDFMAIFNTMTGLQYYYSAKSTIILFQFLAIIQLVGLGRTIFKDPRGAFVFASISVGLMPWVFVDNAPYVFGMLLMITMIHAMLRLNQKTYGIVAIVFLAITISHGLTAVVMVVYALLTLLFPNISKWFRNRQEGQGHVRSLQSKAEGSKLWLLFTLILIFGTWALVSSFFASNLLYFITAITRLGTSPATYQLGFATPYRIPVIDAGFVYLAVFGALLLFAMAFGIKRRSWILFKPLVFAAGIGVAVYFFPFTAQDLYDRIFQTTLPFLAWFIAASIMSMRRRGFHLQFTSGTSRFQVMGLVIVGVLLISGFVFFYSHEGVLIWPRSEVSGDAYLDYHVPSSASVGYFSLAPWPATLADTPTQPTILYGTDYDIPNLTLPIRESSILINSRLVDNSLLYFYGSNIVNTYTSTQRLNLVYSSAGYQIYSRVS